MQQKRPVSLLASLRYSRTNSRLHCSHRLIRHEGHTRGCAVDPCRIRITRPHRLHIRTLTPKNLLLLRPFFYPLGLFLQCKRDPLGGLHRHGSTFPLPQMVFLQVFCPRSAPVFQSFSPHPAKTGEKFATFGLLLFSYITRGILVFVAAHAWRSSSGSLPRHADAP